MREEQTWLTADQLLALAATEGFDQPEITGRKIERWRKEGLLPHPRRISLGRSRGTRSEYPPGTGQQLLALCRLRRRFPHDLDAVRFGLWYERYPLPIDDVRRSIEQLLSSIMRLFPLNEPDPLDTAERLVNQMRSKPRRSSRRSHMKYLKNPDEVNAVHIAILQLALGDVPGFTAHAEKELGERSLAQMFIDALGLHRAQTDRAGRTKPWLPQDNNKLAEQLENMAIEQLLSLPALLQALQESTPEQLTQARADLKGILGFKQVAKAMEALLGPNAFGWGMLSELPNDPVFHALFLAFLIRLGSTPHRVGIDEVKAALRENKPKYQRLLAFLRVLRREYPAIAKEILSQTRALDLSDPHTFEQIPAIFAAVRTNHQEELQAFFQQRPELALLD